MAKSIFTFASALCVLFFSVSAFAADEAAKAAAPNLEKGTVTLNNGVEMPLLGLGTFMQSNEQAAESAYIALKDGYRLIDTAAAYNNEVGVGQGLKRAIDEGIVKREDVFITTKLWPNNYNMGGIDRALEKLGVDYIDLLLLHQPFGDYVEGYKAMEQALADGKVRAIGLSNFNQNQIEELMKATKIKPAVLQVETHIFNQQIATREYLDKYGTALMCWYPLGGRGNTERVLGNETVVKIAKAHNKSAAQIVLRWHVQDAHIAIPGATNPDYIKENIEIYDFELSEEEMNEIRALNQDAPFFGGFGGGARGGNRGGQPGGFGGGWGGRPGGNQGGFNPGGRR